MVQQLNVDELQAFVAQHQAQPPLLLDVRDGWEVAVASISVEGMRCWHVPMTDVPTQLAEIDRSTPVVCVCHHGMRSAQVGAWLERAGFQSVHNLSGGIDAWSLEVDPTVPRY